MGRGHGQLRLGVVVLVPDVDHVDRLLDAVLLPRDLAAHPDLSVALEEVLQAGTALGPHGRALLDGAVAGLAGNMRGLLHLREEPAVAHHPFESVAIDAVQARGVVDVGRRDLGVVHEERPVQEAIRRAGDLRAPRGPGGQLRETPEVQPDGRVSVVAGGAGLRGRRGEHGVGARVTRFHSLRGSVCRLAQPVLAVRHVARGTPGAAIFAVESHPAAQSSALGPEVALHALLSNEVGEVRGQVPLLVGGVELRRLEQAIDGAALDAARRGDGKHGVARVSIVLEPCLEEAVGEVRRGGAVEGHHQVIDQLTVAVSTDSLCDPEVHGVDEAQVGGIVVLGQDPLVRQDRSRRLHVRPDLLPGIAVPPVTLHAGQREAGVHVLNALVALHAALRVRGYGRRHDHGGPRNRGRAAVARGERSADDGGEERDDRSRRPEGHQA